MKININLDNLNETFEKLKLALCSFHLEVYIPLK
jgi:hypothetical protein